jgi:mannose-6-phosphate isomerase-like protein (cupin superfamily)
LASNEPVDLQESQMQLATINNERQNATADDTWKRAAQRALHPTADAVGADVLAAIAAGLAAVTVPWELGLGEVPTERRFHRVLATEAYEAWVICWPSGESLDMHDHGGSAGAFSVVSGELDEATIEAGVTVTRTLAPGDTAVFGASRVHAVANRRTAVATSVHVYSPPLSSMMYYQSHGDGLLVAVGEDDGGWNV